MINFDDVQMSYLASKCEELGQKDMDGMDEKLLRQCLYRIGVMFYRSYHNAGKPEDITKPSLTQELAAV